MKCNQSGCDHEAAYRFTWPGNDEAGICEEHAPKLRTIANAMGMHLQLIPLREPHIDEGRGCGHETNYG